MAIRITKPEVDLRQKLNEPDANSGVAGRELLACDDMGDVFSRISAGRRRLNINGDMAIWQRGTTHTGFSSGNATYHVDRYQSYNSSAGSGVSTISRSTDAPDGFSYSYKVEVTTADTALGSTEEYSIYHYFEGNSVGDLKKGTIHAKHTTVSFWVKTNTPGLYCIEIMDSDNGNRMVSKSYTISKPDVWEYKVVTFPPDQIYQLTHDNTKSIHVNFWLGAGSSYSSSGDGLQEYWGGLAQTRRAVGQTNLYRTVGNTFQITGIQVEAGKTATPFEHRSYGEELALCQRYYWEIDGADGGNGNLYHGNPAIYRASQWFWGVQFPTTMRGIPAHSIEGTNNLSLIEGGGTSRTKAITGSSSHVGPENYMFFIGDSGPSNHDVAQVLLPAAMKIAFDAEL